MPRNSNGTYTLPAGNPVVSGEVISTSWANPTMEDIANEITNSLDRSGRGGMQAPFKNFDGTQSAPGMTWGNEPTTGFWRNAAQDMRVSVGGQPRMRWVATGSDLWDGTIWSPIFTQALYNAQIVTSLAPYAQKAVAEEITGAWKFKAATIAEAALTVQYDNPVLNINDTDAATRQAALKFTTGGGTWSVVNENDLTIKYADVATAPSVGGNIVLHRDDTNGVSIRYGSSQMGMRIGSAGTTVYGPAVFNSIITGLGYIYASSTTDPRFVLQVNGASVGQLQGTSTSARLAAIDARALEFYTNGSLRGSFSSAGAFSVGGTLAAGSTITQGGIPVALTTVVIATTNSLTGGGDLSAGGRTLQLVNDVGSPGSSWYYGTDASGAKGWFPLSAVVGVPEAPIDGQAYARQDASWVSLGSTGSQYVLKSGDTMTGTLWLTANSRPLRVASTGPSITIQDTDGAANQRTWDIIGSNTQLIFRGLLDDASAARIALQFTQKTDGTAAISNIVLGNTSDYPPVYAYSTKLIVGNNAASGAGTPDRQIALYGTAGRLEVGLNMADGTYNSRTALFADNTGKVGLDWVFSNSVDRFEFRRAAVEIFSYNQLGPRTNNVNYNVNSVGGGNALGMNIFRESIQRWLVGMESDAGTNNFRVWRYNTSGVYQGVALDIAADSGSVTVNGALIVGGTSSFGATMTAPEIISRSTESTRLILVGGQSTSLGANARLDLNAGSYSSNAGDLTGYSATNANIIWAAQGTGVVRLSSGGNTKLEANNSFVYIQTTLATRSNNLFRMYNAANDYFGSLGLNTTGKQLYYQDNGTVQGAMLHWESSGLQWGQVQIATSDPATTGNPGTIVLVYE